jgi:hypothetical protein
MIWLLMSRLIGFKICGTLYPNLTPQLGVEKVNFQPKTMPIIVTSNLLEWMGFKGRNSSDKQERFSRILRSRDILYEEIGYQHPLAIEYPVFKKRLS